MAAIEEATRGVELFPDFIELVLLAGNLSFRHQLYSQAEYFYTAAKNKGHSGGIAGLENIRIAHERGK